MAVIPLIEYEYLEYKNKAISQQRRANVNYFEIPSLRLKIQVTLHTGDNVE